MTVSEAFAPPLGPVQSRRKVLLLVNAPVDWFPKVALAPDHEPEAEQEVTFAEDQISDEDAPLVTSEGIAASDTVGVDGPGGGGGDDPCTVTVADVLPLPPDPVQVRVKVLLLAVRGPVDWLPEVATAPVHAPEAEQRVAFVEDQLSDEDAPLVTDVGVATIVTVTFNPVTA